MVIYFHFVKIFKLMATDRFKILKGACLGAIAIYGASIFLSRVKKWRRRKMLTKKAKELKADFDKSIQSKLEELEDENANDRRAILNLNAQSLIVSMQEGKFQPLAVLNAYLHKACSVTKQFNSVAVLLNNAPDVAESLASLPNAREDYPLYGLPVSVKECIHVKGTDSTAGLAAAIGYPSCDDCILVKVLKRCGAVPFVKTNVPQMMASFESSNPVSGTIKNPQNSRFGACGSSSGEGSLIGSGGSILGFGTDAGGSIRGPAHICGITGLNPSFNRISTLINMWGQTGPMAKDVDTLVLAMRALLRPVMFDLDPLVLPLPFNEELFSSKQKLCIGYYVTDGYSKPVPAIQRAVLLAKEALERAGHTLVVFNPPTVEEVMCKFVATTMTKDTKAFLSALENEIVDPAIQKFAHKLSMSSIHRWLLSTFLNFKYPRLAKDFLYHGGCSSVFEYNQCSGEIENYKQEFFAAWKQNGLDAIICPPFPMVAAPIGSMTNLTSLMSCTALYTILQCPAGVVPVTKVNEADMEALKNYRGHYNDPWDWNVKKSCEGSLGVSVGIQCVALPYQDEVCLRVMKEVETLLADVSLKTDA